MRDTPLILPDTFSSKAQSFSGTLAPGDLERLDEALADGRGELRYEVTAVLDRQRRKVVSCIIEGFVFLLCQKSLEAFRHEVSIHDKLVLVDDEARLPAIEEEGDSEDYVVADGPLDIRDLVEDAVLLSLPMVPVKPGLEAGQAGPKLAEPKESPFAALASLKKK